jgi:hypothetical protein
MMTAMTRDQALRLLGLDETSTWAEIRHAYRAEIRRAHPDAGGSFERAASLNQAMAVLARSMTTGASVATSWSAGTGVDVAAGRDSGTDDDLVFVAPPPEIFDRLRRALDQIADVIVADAAGGVLVGDLHRDLGVGRLVVELRPERDERATFAAGGVRTTSTVEFTLDQIGTHAAPPIDRVVRELARLVRSM